jgi:hypothetical protein
MEGSQPDQVRAISAPMANPVAINHSTVGAFFNQDFTRYTPLRHGR